jgi:hypothetical protein
VTAGQIDNLATGDTDQTDPVTDPETVPVPTPSLGIDKPAPSNADEDGSLDVSVGDTLTYTITATNIGTANLTNVTVSDPKITPSSNSCAGRCDGGPDRQPGDGRYRPDRSGDGSGDGAGADAESGYREGSEGS